jgi:membrane protein YfhO
MRFEKLKDYHYIFLAIILAVLFFYPAIISDKTFWFRDIHKWFYPMKYFLATSLKSGNIPFWCPNYYCGSPFMSDLQSGVFYPVSIVFALFPFPFSFNIFIILHIVLGFCFFYLFIKGIGLSSKSALITSISYCYGSYTIATINTLNNLTTLIWLPAILWSFQRTKSKGHKSGFFLTVLFLCMAILGGEPQLFILSTGLLLLFGLFFIPREPSGLQVIAKDTAMIFFLVASAVLITLVQLYPTYMDYQHSIRLGGISYEEATGWSLNLDMLKHFFLPLRFPADFATDPATLINFFPGDKEIPWLLTIYPGFMIVPAAFLGAFFASSKRVLLWVIVFFISLILALGNDTPLYYAFYKLFPFFRFPAKFFFLTSFSLLVIAAYGLDRLFAFLKKKGIGSHLLFFSFAFILTADLYIAHKNLNPLTDSSFYDYYHPSLKPIIEDTGHFRVYLHDDFTVPSINKETIINSHIRFQMFLGPNLGIIHNLCQVTGTSPLELRYQYVIAEILMKNPWEEKLRLLRLSNVKYIITSQRLDKHTELAGQVERINPFVYKIKDYLPRAWILGKLLPIREGTGKELTDGSFDPLTSALAKGKIVEKYNEPSYKKISRIEYDGSKVHIELTVEKPRILMLSESSYPGWRVFVDGKEKPCLWLNLLFQGVEIEKGRHQVTFVFRPKYFGLFSAISLSALAIFFLCWLYFRFSAKKHFYRGTK